MLSLVKAVALPFVFTAVVCTMAILYYTLLWIVVLFGLGDVYARYKDYKRLKKCSHISLKEIKMMARSNCQRNACKAVCKEAKQIYKDMGYRWYHILPDGTWSIRNNIYLKVSFYKNLLGIKGTK